MPASGMERCKHPAILPHDRPRGGFMRVPLCLAETERRAANALPECATGELSMRRSAGQKSSATQFELLDQRGGSAPSSLALEVIKQAATLGNECEQATTGVVILLVVP